MAVSCVMWRSQISAAPRLPRQKDKNNKTEGGGYMYT